MSLVPTGLFAAVAYLAVNYALPVKPLQIALVGLIFGFLGGALPSAADTLLARYRGRILGM
jgi:hypothetical protein